MELNKPSLNQISSLVTALKNPIIEKHIDLEDYDHAWNCLSKITHSQYTEILRLLSINKVKLCRFLITLGFKQNI